MLRVGTRRQKVRKTRTISVVAGMALMAACALIPVHAWSQGVTDADTVQKLRPLNFPKLFPQPTHNNGYEEFVLAADLIINNAKREALDAELSPTLALRRRVLDDPEVTEALRLLRVGLTKPIFSPRTTIDETARFTELIYFRSLGRLLVAEQYVAFADGRVDAAINSLRTGLAFGYRVQTDCLTNGIFGVGIQKMVLTEFSKHLDQLSVYHCNDVRRLVEDFLGVESPVARLLALERDNALRVLEAKRSHPDGLLEWLQGKGGYDDDGNPDADTLAMQNLLKNSPSGMSAVIDDAQKRVNDLYDQVLSNTRLPSAQRKPFATDKANSPGAALARLILQDPQGILDRYATDEDQLHLIGVHALIHRYRWD
ncbi:MAG: hypothetical protein JWN14_4927, partial [Chthonomonadales bacterium]|nr:hypothetical protein [Chthonomonadales bacterium]